MAGRIKNTLWVMGLLSALTIFAGCSSPNPMAVSTLNPDTGNHVTGFSDPNAHGTVAKSQSGGFTSCQECHGVDFAGGVSAVSCFYTCHGVNAPHPRAPWNHGDTNTANAAVCAECHANGSNSPVQPSPSASALSAPPGCFNNTLCHATVGTAGTTTFP